MAPDMLGGANNVVSATDTKIQVHDHITNII